MASIIVIIFLVTTFFILFGIQAVTRLRARQEQRIADYRNSPTSHLLHLND